MKRWIAWLLIITLLLGSCVGCKKASEESATAGEVVESQTGNQDSSDSPTKVPNDQQEGTPVDKAETPDETVPPDDTTDKEEQPNSEPNPEDKEDDDDKKNPVNKPSAGKPNDNKPSVNNPSTDPSDEQQPEEEIPEEEEYPEEEYPEDEEEAEEEEETPDEETPEDEEEDAPAVTPQQKPTVVTPDKIKIVSYNIKALMYGKDTDGIIQELKEMDADVIGLQEVDKNTTRSGKKVHQVKMLAEKLGYPYWSFDKLINYKGGEYGMAILSRYPIINSEVVLYRDQEPDDSHVRKYGRHVLKVGSKNLVFYNTHLCIRDDNDSVSTLQLKEVTDRMAKDVYAVLTGDLNMPAPTAATVVSKKSDMLTLLNDGGPETGKIGPKQASAYIDNIIVSNMMKYHWNTSSGTGVEVNVSPYSDHNLIYTYVSFK